MTPVLRLENVTKRYGQTVAVDDVSFRAEPGRLFGLLGPNGAGKTSTIRMVTFITTPDVGTITLGDEPVGPGTQRRMGYLPEERGLYRKLKVEEQLVYLAQLKGMPERDAKAAVTRWLERFDASDWAGKKTEELSKGQQQKVQFVATMVHDPSLVILDEPFSGLDPINADLLVEVIGELREDGKTVLFASHRMESVEALCDDLCLMAGGRVVLEGPLREVKRRFGRDTVSVEFVGDGAWLSVLEGADAVRVLNRTEGRAELRLTGAKPRDVLEAALAGSSEVDRFEVHEPPLAEIFRQAVQGSEVQGSPPEASRTASGTALPIEP
ncbi:ABC transporter ATP-binding protein [Rubrivirga sp.]|uniref:ABC transporter ATP-binding protein n=1 Tax=Rubrivirga sp. TaxID=1885344 RepID=UPI003C764FC3